MAMPETASPPRRFRVSIGELIGLVALAALACVWPGLIPTEVVAVLFWFASRGGSEQARGRLVSLGVVLAAVYLPALIGFVLAPILDPTINGPQWREVWSPIFPIAPGSRFNFEVASGPRRWREAWSPIFPIAPGSPPIYLLGLLSGLARQLDKIRPGLGGDVEIVLASLTAAAEVGALTFLAGRSRVRRTIAATLGFLLAALGTWLMTLLVVATGGA
jgi:hypothetical protein